MLIRGGLVVKLPLRPKTRQLIEAYLAGEKMTPWEHVQLSRLRREARELDIERVLADIELLRRFLSARRRA